MAHVRRLEEENYLLVSIPYTYTHMYGYIIMELQKMKLSKYKELRNAKELKNRASANAMVCIRKEYNLKSKTLKQRFLCLIMLQYDVNKL